MLTNTASILLSDILFVKQSKMEGKQNSLEDVEEPFINVKIPIDFNDHREYMEYKEYGNTHQLHYSQLLMINPLRFFNRQIPATLDKIRELYQEEKLIHIAINELLSDVYRKYDNAVWDPVYNYSTAVDDTWENRTIQLDRALWRHELA